MMMRYCDFTVFRDQICVIVLNFINIGDPLLRYGDFSIFQDGGRPPCWIFKIAILNVLEPKECQYAWLTQFA